MLALLYPTSVYSAGTQEKKASVRALQNPVLRSYFRQQFLAATHGARIQSAATFAQRFVDRQIEALLARVEQKLTTLEESLDDLEGLQQQIVQGGEVDKKFRNLWKQSTRTISKSSSSLHGILSPIFFKLRSRDAFIPRPIKAPGNVFYSLELRYLRNQGDVATRIIRSYFFNHASTVHLNHLRSTNMLISLHHTHQMARVLQKELS